MKKKPFILNEWLNKQDAVNRVNTNRAFAEKSGKDKNNNFFSSNRVNTGERSDLETIIRRIEASATDIAPRYADWRNVGFALADELGEGGRDFFHRISRFYPQYTTSETDKQYDKCLKATGNGVSIKTIFHLAKEAGIDIGVSAKSSLSPISPSGETEDLEETEDESRVELPNIPDQVFDQLPMFLRRVVQNSNSPEDKDILLLGSIVTLSACLPNIYGNYAKMKVFPNLFLFVSAQASAGKGRLSLCRKLVEPIHKSLKEKSMKEKEIYERELNEYVQAKKEKTCMEKPVEPPMRMLIIPANNSATGLFQILNDNNGAGLLFETEGDTLSQTFKSEHGNYSDGFRKAFHHENISYNRRQNREYVEIEKPRLSAVLSGTPGQISTLIPDAENGLFSRFMFYYMNIRPTWIDVFAGQEEQTLDDYFEFLGDKFYEFYKLLENQSFPMRFSLSLDQQKDFNKFFDQTQNTAVCIQGIDYIASVRRLGLITFRIAMILTALRLMDSCNFTSPLICCDEDYNSSMKIAEILNVHASMIFQQLPSNKMIIKQPNLKQQFFDMLPDEFNRKIYLEFSSKLKIPPKTAEKHIKHFVVNGLIIHFAHDKYKKQ